MNVTDDARFNEVFEVFTKQISIHFRESFNEMSRRNYEEQQKMAKQAREMEEKHGGRASFDLLPIRIHGHREHGEIVGRNFLSSFMEIINPHCEFITDNQKTLLLNSLNKQYESARNTAEMGIRSYYASQGMNPEQSNSTINHVNNYYSSAHNKSQDNLIIEIKKHNLRMSKRETQEIKNREVKEVPQKKRNRRTKERLGDLMPKVEKAYYELYGDGKYSVKEVFAMLSKQSKELFGEQLSAGQLRGLYNRRESYL